MQTTPNATLLEEYKTTFGQTYLRIFQPEDSPVLLSVWEGMNTLDRIKEGHEAVLNLIKAHKIKHYCVDTTLVEGIWLQSNSWIAAQWVPRALQAGIVSMSLVMPQDTLANMSAQDLLELRLISTFDLRHFNHYEEALLWHQSL